VARARCVPDALANADQWMVAEANTGRAAILIGPGQRDPAVNQVDESMQFRS
jgi:hypothetical protein